jgi:hypothetical protein
MMRIRDHIIGALKGAGKIAGALGIAVGVIVALAYLTDLYPSIVLCVAIVALLLFFGWLLECSK